jgi:hypothetical protein
VPRDFRPRAFSKSRSGFLRNDELVNATWYLRYLKDILGRSVGIGLEIDEAVQTLGTTIDGNRFVLADVAHYANKSKLTGVRIFNSKNIRLV